MANVAAQVSMVAVPLILLNAGCFLILRQGTAPARFAGVERSAATPPPAPFEPSADDGSPSRLDILRMLRQREFTRLADVIDVKHALVIQNIRHESELHRVLLGFEVDDPAITALIEEWIAAAPASTPAHLAHAVHLNARAFAARGTRLISETSEQQTAAMHELHERAVAAAFKVVEQDARHTLAYATLVNAARARGDQEACGTFAQQGLEQSPASLRIRWALAACRLPRWGGSHELVEQIAKQARPFLADHPELSVLQGAAAWDQGRIAEGEEALQLFGTAIASGPFPIYFYDRAREHLRMKQPAVALEDVTLALALSPDDPAMLETRMSALADLGRVKEAAAAFAVLEEVDATNADLGRWRDYFQRLAQRAAATAVSDTFNEYLRADAEMATRGDWNGIIAQWTTYLQQHPNDGRAYLERGGAHHRKGDLTSARHDIESACGLGTTQACDIAKRQGWQ